MIHTWFITGVSSGFGRELAEQLLSQGKRVAGTARRLEAVADLTADYPDAFNVWHLDVTDTPRIREVVDAAHERFGRLDVVVSNAGYGLFGAAEEATDDQIRHQIDTNLIGSIQLLRAALPHLRADGGGRILQLSSVGGHTAHPGGTLYQAAKWGIEGFTEALAAEVAPFNISVTIVEPGGARTSFAGSSLRLTPKLDAYDVSPSSTVRQALESGVDAPGDPARMAAAMIDNVDQDPAPLRLPLGSDSWTPIVSALESRLEDLRARKDVALSVESAD
ncbi:SDR family oxidoreductase [Haloactinomyces albus]|uniref:NAD(P)-dependent dehydrogenase (Short-subunit alcohol dehydrogenase family) n=1 Tax=Haloactinomyces albus TaxID=1352928 RepID=A0AAE3ZB12_9ACTN|nr:SDR family oxidoreductase [Haloactinomyces albus]MDR7301607.1 NAD(P)-dependent dehydrogenase (short-subunit alcohol dehydrogenase family) [Haloactinomyces albus]